MARQADAQKETVARVMHEFKHGELEAAGRKVRNPRQAIAIGLSEAGASRDKSPKQNRKALARTKSREGDAGETRAELYGRAAERGIAGRSKMNKAELQAALAKSRD